MKGCHVGKGGGTQLKLGSLWLLEMMVLVDCDKKFLIIGEHFVLRLENFFQYLGSWIWDCSFFVSVACAPVFTILINVDEMFENTTYKKEKWPNARILYILKTNIATNTEKKKWLIVRISSRVLNEDGRERLNELWSGEESRKLSVTEFAKGTEGLAVPWDLETKTQKQNKKKKTKLKVNLHWWPVMSATAIVLSGTNEDIPESRGKILALLLATFDW